MIASCIHHDKASNQQRFLIVDACSRRLEINRSQCCRHFTATTKKLFIYPQQINCSLSNITQPIQLSMQSNNSNNFAINFILLNIWHQCNVGSIFKIMATYSTICLQNNLPI